MSEDSSFSSGPKAAPLGDDSPAAAGVDLSRLTPEQLLPLIYDQLRKLARQYMSGERVDHTIQTTARCLALVCLEHGHE